jgi:hypothetical protein
VVDVVEDDEDEVEVDVVPVAVFPTLIVILSESFAVVPPVGV